MFLDHTFHTILRLYLKKCFDEILLKKFTFFNINNDLYVYQENFHLFIAIWFLHLNQKFNFNNFNEGRKHDETLKLLMFEIHDSVIQL